MKNCLRKVYNREMKEALYAQIIFSVGLTVFVIIKQMQPHCCDMHEFHNLSVT
jgi:hypothetical protein